MESAGKPAASAQPEGLRRAVRVGDSADVAYDLDFSDLSEVQRRVVDPVLSAFFKPGELREAGVQLGHPFGDAPAFVGDAPEVWLSAVDVDGDPFIYRLGKATAELWDAVDVADGLADALQDAITESRYGWGEVREASYEVPPPASE